MKKYFAFFFLLFLLAQNGLWAQDSAQSVKIFAIETSPVGYKGDLGSPYSQWGSAFGISLHSLKESKFSKGVSFSAGRIRGNDPNFRPDTEAVPNRSFSTSYYNASFDLHYNFIKSDNFWLYAGSGVGLMYFIVKDDNGNRLAAQFNTRNKGEDYANISLTIPLKIGANYLFDNGIGVGFQAGMLNPMTKYLDNIGELGKNKRDNVLFAKFSLCFTL